MCGEWKLSLENLAVTTSESGIDQLLWLMNPSKLRPMESLAP